MANRKHKWDFLPIDKRFQRDTFDCGNRVLNQYIKKYAWQNHQKGIAKTFIALPASGGLKVNGYYTITTGIIEYESFPESYQRKMPASPITATLIDKLAVDSPVQGQGLGEELLVDALYRIVCTAQEIGIFAIRVDAIDLQAKEFYLKHEFIPFQDKELSLFLPLESIAREFYIDSRW
ncbi:MAG: GNAT family N-acetyltransferase [Symploca sp. SIO1B1]|nr:GNAT family N-acetyltransferase [Symploca sp. SIO1C2]NER46216.1 GNAT family N-acetyltransferase [Symploca sp. SIO1A3]NER95467.1 GNAT family N-acetyltransferase [Symploca sp. SIO1B1]